MNKTELTVEKEAAVQAHENANKKGKQLLEDLYGQKTFVKEVTDRIKTFSDVLKDNNISDVQLDVKHQSLKSIGLEHMYYQWIAELIAKSLNEGWQPNWDDSREYKYFPWFKMGSPGFRFNGCVSWTTTSAVGSRLCFKNSKLAKYAGENFTDVYEKFMLIK